MNTSHTTVTKDTYVVLWSPHQEQFHIEQLGRMIEINQSIFLENSKGDYILLSFAQTSDEAYDITRKLDALRKKHHRA